MVDLRLRKFAETHNLYFDLDTSTVILTLCYSMKQEWKMYDLITLFHQM